LRKGRFVDCEHPTFSPAARTTVVSTEYAVVPTESLARIAGELTPSFTPVPKPRNEVGEKFALRIGA